VHHTALLPISLLPPNVPVAHPFKGFYRPLRAALTVHLVAQGHCGRLELRLADRGE